ncbi:MAG: universal stress protein [Candidatus Dadabacteria bacterium]
MKKFLAAFDGLDFSESTMNYAIYVAKSCEAHLVGVFLEDFTRHSYSISDVAMYEGASFDSRLHDLDDHDKETREKSIEMFEHGCREAGLNYSIHRDRNVALQDLLHESIYADLLIINAQETMNRFEENPPSRFIRDLLTEVQCPTLVVPIHYRQFDKIILLYDGEPSSVHAVRTFSYLFDSIKSLDTGILTVKRSEENLHFPDNRLMKEFIKRHYPKAEFVVLKGMAEDEIVQFLHREKGDPVVVLGAYSRSRISRLFRPSMADNLLQHVKMPLFIAHNKS